MAETVPNLCKNTAVVTTNQETGKRHENIFKMFCGMRE
jgi:hypothetical protein